MSEKVKNKKTSKVKQPKQAKPKSTVLTSGSSVLRPAPFI